MDSLTTPSPKQSAFLATFCQQLFPFPDSLIYYITKNPSTPKCYEKMIQSCKHFFIKNPILIVQRFYLLIDGANNEIKALFNNSQIDCSNLTLSKIWITETFAVNNGIKNEPTLLPYSIIQKIYKSDIKEILLGNQNISNNDLKNLASKCEIINFEGVAVMNENGSIVTLEKIVEILPFIKELSYCLEKIGSKVITSSTVPELLKLPHFCNLTYFCFINIPEAFDIDTFYGFIKENKNTRIWLDFDEAISNGFKIRLQKIVNEIVKNENRDFKVPFIRFRENDQTEHNKLWDLCLLSS